MQVFLWIYCNIAIAESVNMSEKEKDPTYTTWEDIERMKEAERKKPGFNGEYPDRIKRMEVAVKKREEEERRKAKK